MQTARGRQQPGCWEQCSHVRVSFSTYLSSVGAASPVVALLLVALEQQLMVQTYLPCPPLPCPVCRALLPAPDRIFPLQCIARSCSNTTMLYCLASPTPRRGTDMGFPQNAFQLSLSHHSLLPLHITLTFCSVQGAYQTSAV